MNPNYEVIKQSGITLMEWLNSPCFQEDLRPLPWDGTIFYMPIDVVRNKIDIMEEVFGATVDQIDVSVSAINTFDKDTCFWGAVKFIIYHSDFRNGEKIICGTASFLKSQYTGSWSFSQISEALSISRCFGKQWKQFGRDINKDPDTVKEFNSPSIKSQNNLIKNTLRNAT